MKFSKTEILIFALMVVLFVLLRAPGIHLPLHQDEYKWPIIVNPSLTAPGGIPHPPVGEFVYKTAGQMIGYDNFRYVPVFFSFINLFLLFYLVQSIFSSYSKSEASKVAFWGIFLFTASFYSVLASLMVDTDGAIMPFFFLLATISYYKLRNSDFKVDHTKQKWLFLLLLSTILGFLVKVSFLVGVSALVLDFALGKNIFSDKKKVLKYFGVGIAATAGFVLILIASRFLFPYFNLESSVKYWEHFVKFSDRGWLQTLIQFIKSVLYTSPLLLLPVFLADKEIWEKTRPFFLLIFIGLFFYLFAFDFSTGALDRYFQFLILPLCIISGAVFAKIFMDSNVNLKIGGLITVFTIAILIFSLQFFNHFVPPLHPKAEWINRAVSFKWNFLYPFTGGSGPLGFYISFLFMAIAWVSSASLVVVGFVKPHFRKVTISILISIGLVYNGVFVEEYLFGKVNGFTPKLVYGAVEFIENNPDIKYITVYNDNGGAEVQATGKYRKRLYTDPAFDVNSKVATLNQYKEHYLEIDIPRIDPKSVYRKYLDSCDIIYKQTDNYISATIYDCRWIKDIKP